MYLELDILRPTGTAISLTTTDPVEAIEFLETNNDGSPAEFRIVSDDTDEIFAALEQLCANIAEDAETEECPNPGCPNECCAQADGDGGDDA